MSEWLPIETAPKDGTRVVLTAWCGHNKQWCFTTSYWRKYLEEYGEGFGWLGREPSHWMPLPLPPSPDPR